jgi:stage IV sporulation protein B
MSDRGDVLLNHECGVFGILDAPETTTSVPIAYRDEVQEGEATLLTTVRQGKTLSYKIRIRDIDRESTTNKSFLVEVTDPALIALTGGIVRGMSGSPIIQNGKLVGAVTHVLVNDPTTGYGIFIENMLNASESARNELPAA